MLCVVRKHGQNGQKGYSVHRFVYECFNGIIPDGNIKNEVSYYNSMYSINQHLGINAGIVKMVCEGINNCKTGISKKDNCHYKFEYVEKDELPADHKKSANERPIRFSVEDRKKRFKESLKRWRNKEYECLKCGKTYKNGYKFIHKKNANR